MKILKNMPIHTYRHLEMHTLLIKKINKTNKKRKNDQKGNS